MRNVFFFPTNGWDEVWRRWRSEMEAGKRLHDSFVRSKAQVGIEIYSRGMWRRRERDARENYVNRKWDDTNWLNYQADKADEIAQMTKVFRVRSESPNEAKIRHASSLLCEWQSFFSIHARSSLYYYISCHHIKGTLNIVVDGGC